jgi:dihydrofolate synthase / folylpolyglutamate synthase
LTAADWAARAEQVAEALYARAPEHQIRPRLEPTRRAVEIMGDPQRNYRVIHITGTNGKTTTARMIERILREHGLRTGRFTSPHLVSFNERIAIDGEPISDETLVLAYEENAPLLELIDSQLESEGEAKLTFFEAMAALAFQIFSDAPIDVLVLEVGMGGEWDSTNVADGELALFTTVALDHQKSLGNTLTEIASTKAGIIKPESIVLSGPQAPEVAAVLTQRSAGNSFLTAGSEFELLESSPDGFGTRFSVRGKFASYPNLWMPIMGDHQASNATLAVAAIEQFLGRAIEPEILRIALQDTVSPGRLQVIGKDPLEVFDGAHNLAGAEAFASWASTRVDPDNAVGVIGILDDKNAREMLRVFARAFRTAVLVQPESPRAIPAKQLAEDAAEFFETAQWAASPFEGLELARKLARESGGAVLATGSLYLVGNLLRDLRRNLEQEIEPETEQDADLEIDQEAKRESDE